MAHYGFLFDLDESWIGGSYYIRNLISALGLVAEEDQPEVSIIAANPRSFDFVRETGYGKLHWVLRQQFDAEPDSFPFDMVFPWPIPSQSYRTVAWIPDLQEYHLPELFSAEDLRHRRQTHETSFKGMGVVVSSNDVKADVERFYKDIHPEIAVVHFAAFNAYDLSKLVAVRKKYNLASDYIMCPNQVWIHKNHIVVLKALSILKERGLGLNLVFTGHEKDYRAKGYIDVLKRLCVEWGIDAQVHFLGFIPREDQLLLMKGAEYILQPSLFEGWSTVIEDSKWMGQFVLASDLRVHIEQLTQNGMHFPASNPLALADAMEKLAANPPTIEAVDYKQAQRAFGRDFVAAVARFSKKADRTGSSRWMSIEQFSKLAESNLRLLDSGLAPQTAAVSNNSAGDFIPWQQHTGKDLQKRVPRPYTLRESIAFARGYQGKKGGRLVVFDPAYYRMQNPSVRTTGFSSLVHYLRHGHPAQKLPHPLFDENYYLRKYPDVAKSSFSPIIHFLRKGIDEGRDPHPLFDTAFYLDRHKDVAARGIPAFVHFVRDGLREGRTCHPLFDQAMYLRRHADVGQANMPALLHFLYHGFEEGRAPHPLFDARFYLDTYPEVRASGMNPFKHFVEYGISLDYSPNAFFDPAFYNQRNPDVVQSGISGIRHYLIAGQFEHRSPGPQFDAHLYLNANPDVAASGMPPLSHYLWWGKDEGRVIYPARSTDEPVELAAAGQFYSASKRRK